MNYYIKKFRKKRNLFGSFFVYIKKKRFLSLDSYCIFAV